MALLSVLASSYYCTESSLQFRDFASLHSLIQRTCASAPPERLHQQPVNQLIAFVPAVYGLFVRIIGDHIVHLERIGEGQSDTVDWRLRVQVVGVVDAGGLGARVSHQVQNAAGNEAVAEAAMLHRYRPRFLDRHLVRGQLGYPQWAAVFVPAATDNIRYDTVYLCAIKRWWDGQPNLALGTETKNKKN